VSERTVNAKTRALRGAFDALANAFVNAKAVKILR
jgi:hypothetical protein